MSHDGIPVPRGAVVVGVDGSASSALAMDWAVEEAGRRRLPVHLLHVFVQDYPTMTIGIPPHMEDLRSAADDIVDDAVNRVASMAPGVTVTSSMATGSAAKHLIDASTRADTVVVGTHGRRGLTRLLLGST